MKNNKVKQRGVGSMYACKSCQTVRQFGFDLPDDVTVEPFLNCGKCGKPTRHCFSRLAPMVELKLPYGETRWVLEFDALESA